MAEPPSRLAPETAVRVRSMASENRLWGAERIRGKYRLDRRRIACDLEAELEHVGAERMVFRMTHPIP